MREPARVRAILTAVCSVATKPVLAKIRAGWDDGERNAVEIARIARDCGVAAVTVHGRTGRQGFTGLADWGAIREVVGRRRAPGGRQRRHRDARSRRSRRCAETGCAAVMIGRGAYGNPWIFREAAALLAGSPLPRPTDAESSAASWRATSRSRSRSAARATACTPCAGT